MNGHDGKGEILTMRKIQYGALPFWGQGRHIEVLMITSRTSHRWIFPKGNPITGLRPHESAGREAYEEGGIVGDVNRISLGAYSCLKAVPKGGTVHCEVTLFPMRVYQQLPKWPEMGHRDRQWVSPEQAKEMAGDPGIATVVEKFMAEYVPSHA